MTAEPCDWSAGSSLLQTLNLPVASNFVGFYGGTGLTSAIFVWVTAVSEAEGNKCATWTTSSLA